MTNIIESLTPLIIPISTVKPDPKNTRSHPVRNLDTIKRSLQTYGQRKPIVVNAETMTIEAGNGLFSAAKALGWTEIAAVMVKDSKEVAAAYGIMDNQSALLADWDLPNLKDILQELDDGETDMATTGFSDDEIENLMVGAHIPELTEFLRPKEMLRILISVPVDNAIEVKETIDSLLIIPGVEVDFGANDKKD